MIILLHFDYLTDRFPSGVACRRIGQAPFGLPDPCAARSDADPSGGEHTATADAAAETTRSRDGDSCDASAADVDHGSTAAETVATSGAMAGTAGGAGGSREACLPGSKRGKRVDSAPNQQAHQTTSCAHGGACACATGPVAAVSPLSLFADGLPPRLRSGCHSGPRSLVTSLSTLQRPLPQQQKPLVPQQRKPQAPRMPQHPLAQHQQQQRGLPPCSRGSLPLRAGRALAAATAEEACTATGRVLDRDAAGFLHDVSMTVPSGPSP